MPSGPVRTHTVFRYTPVTKDSWVHRTPDRCPVYVLSARCVAGEQAPGLRGLLLPAVMLSRRTTSPLVFSYLRPVSPGHPDRHQSIRGKCWIASRSRVPGAGQAPGAWLGGPGPSQRPPGGLWDPVLGPFWPGSGPSGTRIRAVWTRIRAILASPAGQEAGFLAAFDRSVV